MDFSKLLEMSVFEVMETMEIDIKKAKSLRRSAALSVVPKTVTAACMVDSQWLPTGIAQLDDNNCGIPYKMITEIVGPPGMGKSQLCMQLLCETANSGNSAIFIDTEMSFSATRLSEICIKRFPSSSCKEIGEKIHITVELTADSLLERLDFCEKIISAKLPGCKLIIIDSIGCIAKKQFYQSLIERSRFMMKLTAKLKNLAVQYGLAVVVVNQVTGKLVFNTSGKCEETEDQRPTIQSGSIVSALGPTWAHLVNVRIALRKSNVDRSRQLVILKSPFCSIRTLAYHIDERGVNVDQKPAQELPATDLSTFRFDY